MANPIPQKKDDPNEVQFQHTFRICVSCHAKLGELHLATCKFWKGDKQ